MMLFDDYPLLSSISHLLPRLWLRCLRQELQEQLAVPLFFFFLLPLRMPAVSFLHLQPISPALPSSFFPFRPLLKQVSSLLPLLHVAFSPPLAIVFTSIVPSPFWFGLPPFPSASFPILLFVFKALPRTISSPLEPSIRQWIYLLPHPFLPFPTAL